MKKSRKYRNVINKKSIKNRKKSIKNRKKNKTSKNKYKTAKYNKKKGGSNQYSRLKDKSHENIYLDPSLSPPSNECIFNSDSTSFFHFLYDKNIAKIFNDDFCGTSGSFVFEDNNSELFDKLLDCKTNYFKKQTHQRVMLKQENIFRIKLKNKENTRPKLLTKKMNTKDFSTLKTKYQKDKYLPPFFYMYEIILDPPITLLCNQLSCSNGIEKGVVFIYHFIGENDNKIQKEFTFLKLEESPQTGNFKQKFKHAFNAVHRYHCGRNTKTKTFREDCKLTRDCDRIKCDPPCDGFHDEKKNKEESDQAYEFDPNKDQIKEKYNIEDKFDLKKEGKESIEHYNTFYRTGDEIFIPQEKTEYLLKKYPDWKKKKMINDKLSEEKS